MPDDDLVSEFGVAGPWGYYFDEEEAAADPSDGSEFYSLGGSYADPAARLERAVSTNDPLTRRLGPASTRRRALSTDLDP
jgi:hypothetical protein